MQGRRRFVARVTPIRRSLRSLRVVRRQLAKLRLSLHDLHHPLPKVEPNLFQTHLLPAVLHRVVKQPRHQRLCIHVQLCQDPGHLDRMRDEWLPAFSQLPRMRVKRQRQGVPNERNILGGNVVEHWLQPRAPQKFLAHVVDFHPLVERVVGRLQRVFRQLHLVRDAVTAMTAVTAVTAVAAVMMLHRPQPRDPPPIGRPSTTRLATQRHQRCRQQRRRRGPERPGMCPPTRARRGQLRCESQ
mmetsp:Transcript_11265/g.31538  ORF Transcript_11265/g.31538 Transcript_11265/m.31538 type:complete len:242 (-) Transcript_11265:304-1029(-)